MFFKSFCGSVNPYYENPQTLLRAVRGTPITRTPTILVKLFFLEVLAGVKRALFQKRVSCVGSGAKLLTKCASLKKRVSVFCFFIMLLYKK